MKNNKAFTLIELLGVLVILGLIVLVSFPNIITSIQKSAETEYKRFKKDIELLAESYVDRNINNFNLVVPGDSEFILLIDLVNEGYLNRKLVNPKTKEQINTNNTVLVTVLNDNTKRYEYTDTEAGLNNYRIPNLKIFLDGYKRPTIEADRIFFDSIIGESKSELINFVNIDDWNNNRIKLTGVDNHIKVLGSSNLIPTDSEVTIEIVYEITQDTVTGQFNNAGLGLEYFNLYIDTGVISSSVRNSTNTANLWPEATSARLAESSKLHTLTITMKKNGSSFDFKYFGDGIPLTTTNSTGLKSGNLDFTIGKDYSTVASPVYIYGFRVYDALLNTDEILNNYQIDLNRYKWREK